MTSPAVALLEALSLAEAALVQGFTGSSDTIKDTVTCTRAFGRFARHHGVHLLEEVTDELVCDFIWRPVERAGRYRHPAPSTVYNRRWEVSEIFTTLTRLKLWSGPVVFGEAIPHKNGDGARPLSDSEMRRVRVHSYNWLIVTRRPLVVALSEAGGSALEVALVEREDLDLGRALVSFRGPEERTSSIPAEALVALRRAMADGAMVGARRLAVGDDLDDLRAKRSVTQELSSVIREAGLGAVDRVSGRSIRLHHALRVYESHGIGAAVRFLGARSVDLTMRSLGLTVADL